MKYTPLDESMVTFIKTSGARFLEENVPHFLDSNGYRNLIVYKDGSMLTLNKSKFNDDEEDKWEAWSETPDGNVVHWQNISNEQVKMIV